MEKFVSHTSSYDAALMFAQISAATIAVRSTPALAASVRRNDRNGAVFPRLHSVRSRIRNQCEESDTTHPVLRKRRRLAPARREQA
jgi:hypothetical protein